MPLRALLNEEPVLAWNLTEENRGLPFKCPMCDDDMIIVLPQSGIIKHFRHVNEEAHGEPETPEHLAMKKYFYDLCIKNNMPVKMEAPIKNHNRKTDRFIDVLIDNKISLECQCSPITTDKILERGVFDICNELGTIWVLGGKYYENTKTKKLHQRVGRKPYYIQRTKKSEMTILNWQGFLLYFGNHPFLGSFKHRGRAKMLGWYNLYKIHPEKILPFLFWLHENSMKV